MQMTKLFHPLTGPELREIIINEFTSKLDNSTLFQPHLTFPKAIFKIELTLESYPMNQPEEFRAERILEVEGVPVKAPVTEKIVTSREVGDTQETAPDALRIENELPVPQTVQDPVTGFHTDGPLVEEGKVTVGAGTRPRGRVTRVTVGKGSRARDEAEALTDEGNVRFNTSA